MTHKPKADHAPEELEQLKQQLQQAQEQSLRALADVENTKKRLSREKEEFVRYAAETVVRELLPIVDSLDQALVAVDPSTRSANAGLARDSAPRTAEEREAGASVGFRKQSDIEAIIKGVQLIHRQLLGVLDREGVRRIQTIGESFDPHRHEAVAQVDAKDGTPEHTIMEEVQVGYTMHGRVIRPAMVKVAKSGNQQSAISSKSQEEPLPTAEEPTS